jgi:HK97 family phage portal protein
VSPHSYATSGAQGVSAVLSAINFISSNVAALQPIIYSVAPDGRRTENLVHGVNRVLASPNGWQTGPELIEYMIAGTLLDGNAFAVLEHDLSGRLTEVRPYPWGAVSMGLTPSGKPVYDLNFMGRPTARYLASEVIHLKDRGDNPYIGVSRLRRAASAVEHAVSADTAASSLFQRSARPSGAFKFGAKLSDTQSTRFQQNVEAISGAIHAGKVMILEDGVEFVEMGGVNGRDAEILASRQWSTTEICRIYGIPPCLLGDLSNAGGTAMLTQAMTLFGTTTLTSWVRRFEAAFNAAVFGATTGSTFALALDMSGLQRADPATRVAADNILLSHGVISKNECRESWGYSQSNAAGMDDFTASPQTGPGGFQTSGTQHNGMAGAPT